jgi:hypothetical protein
MSLNGIRTFFGRLLWPFKVAYLGRTEGYSYEPEQTGIGVKALAETFKEVLALYAAYSEVAEKFVKTIPFVSDELSKDWLRVLTSALAVFVSGYILFATKEGKPKVYAYTKLARRVAGVLIWLMIFSLGQSLYYLVWAPNPYIGRANSVYSLPREAWQLKADAPPSPDTLTYTAKLGIPEGQGNKYKDLGVRILPLDGFTLEGVDPAHSNTVAQEQEPAEDGNFSPTRSGWHFRDFDEKGGWTFTVKLRKPKGVSNPPPQPPIEAYILLYKD